MQTLVETSSNLSKYLFDDSVVVTLSETETTTSDGYIIGDLNASNAVLYSDVTAPDDWAGNRYKFDGQVWTLAPNPPPAPEPVVEPQRVSPIEFMLLFTSEERVTIRAARETDPVIDDYFAILEDLRLTYVDLGLQETENAIGYLQHQGFLTVERAGKILEGKVV